jgi:hypothetical protein
MPKANRRIRFLRPNPSAEASISSARRSRIVSFHPAPGRKGGTRSRGGAVIEAAVVVTATLIDTAPEPLGVTEVGFTVHVDSDAGSEHVKLMVWLNPPSPPKLSE